MTKMTEAQRRAILDAHVRQLDRIGTGTVSANPGTVKVLRREGWVSMAFATFDKPTPAGLRAAGIDFDLLHRQALVEHCDRLGILDEPDSPRGRTFAQAVYSSTDGTYASALDLLHEEALKLNASSQTNAGQSPRYPEGTPEHAAYVAELKVELDKFAHGEEPYPYRPGRPLADREPAEREPSHVASRLWATEPEAVHYAYDDQTKTLCLITKALPDVQHTDQIVRTTCGSCLDRADRIANDTPPQTPLSDSLPREQAEFDTLAQTARAASTPTEPTYVPATAYGLELWQHACGSTALETGPVQPHPDQCDTCRRFRPLTSDPWRRLYVRVPNTPAEARTSISDRVAAALSELADVRAMICTGVIQSHDARSSLRERIARAEKLLRAAVGQRA